MITGLIRTHIALGGILVAPLLFGICAVAQTPPPASRRTPPPVRPDLTGDWSIKIHEDDRYRNPGAELGEYEGIPLNEAGRLKASSWNASLNTLPERQCLPLPADDFTDFGNMRIWKEVDPATRQVIAWHEYTEWGGQERTIWMDGRPHPSPYAPHTWQGFSTGEWEHNQLTITTTHLKMAPFERIGIYRSDAGSLREHWVRHGEYLTITLIISDPVYLEAPFIRTRDYLLEPESAAARMDVHADGRNSGSEGRIGSALSPRKESVSAERRQALCDSRDRGRRRSGNDVPGV